MGETDPTTLGRIEDYKTAGTPNVPLVVTLHGKPQGGAPIMQPPGAAKRGPMENPMNVDPLAVVKGAAASGNDLRYQSDMLHKIQQGQIDPEELQLKDLNRIVSMISGNLAGEKRKKLAMALVEELVHEKQMGESFDAKRMMAGNFF